MTGLDDLCDVDEMIREGLVDAEFRYGFERARSAYVWRVTGWFRVGWRRR